MATCTPCVQDVQHVPFTLYAGRAGSPLHHQALQALLCRCLAALAPCRLMADESPDTERVAAAFNVVEVPTFIFMRSGREVARHVGSSRGDLIGKILQVGVLTTAGGGCG